MTTIVNSMTSIYQNPGQYPSSHNNNNNTDRSIYGLDSLSSPNPGLSKEPNPFEKSFSAVRPQINFNQQQLPPPTVSSFFPPEIQNSSLPYIAQSNLPSIPQPQPSLPQANLSLNNSNFSIRNQIPFNVPSPWLNPNLPPYGTSSYQVSRKGIGGRKRKPTEGMDPKKIQFLERNRQAALKCRLRKKKRLETTQIHRSILEQQNMQLSSAVQELTDLRRQLKLLLHNNSNCPVYQKTIQYPY